MARAKVPRRIESSVLTKCRRRCALCTHLHNDWGPKRGQVAHIDKDPSNNDEENLAFLCLDHHDEYDTRNSQSKGITENELKHAKSQMEQRIEGDSSILGVRTWSPKDESAKASSATPPETYSLRKPVYDAIAYLLARVGRDATISRDDVNSFAVQVRDAHFLFGREIEGYCGALRDMAFKLAQLGIKQEHPHKYSDQEWNAIIDEESELLDLFMIELRGLKEKFSPYLSLGEA